MRYTLSSTHLKIPELDFVAEVENGTIQVPAMDHLDQDFIDTVIYYVEKIAEREEVNVNF